MGKLSIEEMLKLTKLVTSWKPTRICRHLEKEYSFIKPSVEEFEEVVENIVMNIKSSSEGSFSRWYKINVSTDMNILGEYREKESKCVPGLKTLFLNLELRYVENYLEKVRQDMENGLDNARRLIK